VTDAALDWSWNFPAAQLLQLVVVLAKLVPVPQKEQLVPVNALDVW
jgi:hypothetical protein